VNADILLTSSVIGATVAGTVTALLNSYWNRQAAKKLPKTEMRADAYRDFAVYLFSAISPDSAGTDGKSSRSASLLEIKARLLLFGESNVVAAVCALLARHAALNTDAAVGDILKVVCEMRKSLLTGYAQDVVEGIRGLLLSEINTANKLLNPDGTSRKQT
jgi:hypothetical protein